jgi:homoserine O-acetyltransferase/O-succinyltransferase
MFEFIPPTTRWFDLPSPFAMHAGGHLQNARLAYETWGELNAERSNAILLLPGMSPNAHAASHQNDSSPGWWEWMLGSNKPIDTNRWFVICINPLGSCKGSTGPASLNPATQAPYRLHFPELHINDVAHAAALLVQHLGIEQLDCLIGNSMGGMCALSLLQQFPGISRRHINICSALRSSTHAIAIRALQREAICADPHWQQGEYSATQFPEHGMRIARKLGMLSYRSADEWEERFGRTQAPAAAAPSATDFNAHYAIESYLEAHAQRFATQFDPASYLYLSRAMDRFELAEDALQNDPALQHALVIGVTTDTLFPINQQEDIARLLHHSGCQTRFLKMASIQGHDAFLVDQQRFAPAVAQFLNHIPHKKIIKNKVA